jgi:hypothetical protein
LEVVFGEEVAEEGGVFGGLDAGLEGVEAGGGNLGEDLVEVVEEGEVAMLGVDLVPNVGLAGYKHGVRHHNRTNGQRTRGT